MTDNCYWKCPRCGCINDESEWWDNGPNAHYYDTECSECGYKVKVTVEMWPHFYFESLEEDGRNIEALEEWETKK